VLRGEVWRLVTPIFLHFGIWHLLFNLLWLFQLGSMIERRLGTGTLAAVVLGTAALSNLAQALVSGPNFGGMSGVVYALAGYVWMRGKHDPNADVYLDPQSMQWLLIWLVLCFTGLLGPVANTAHVVGLVAGAVWGRLAAWRAWRR
jgi:GlpG protein